MNVGHGLKPELVNSYAYACVVNVATRGHPFRDVGYRNGDAVGCGLA